MSLESWAGNRWIVRHAATVREIGDLFAVVDRDLKDAAVPRLSDDWRVGITYNAALQLATIALAAEGYRAGARARDPFASGHGWPLAEGSGPAGRHTSQAQPGQLRAGGIGYDKGSQRAI